MKFGEAESPRMAFFNKTLVRGFFLIHSHFKVEAVYLKMVVTAINSYKL